MEGANIQIVSFLKDRLVQLVQNMPEMTTDTPDSNTLPSTTAVHTESQTMSPSTLAEGQENLTKERSYSMMTADIEGLKLDLLILQKR